MITITTANIFDAAKDDRTFVVHGTNCQGVMGAGIAATIKNLYPGAYDVYRQQLGQKEGLVLGEFTAFLTSKGFWILNLQTQEKTGGTRRPVSYDTIDFGFRNVAGVIHTRFDWMGKPIRPEERATIRFPLIGCGLGGGNWDIVSAILDAALPDSHFIKKLHLLNLDDMPKSSTVAYSTTF